MSTNATLSVFDENENHLIKIYKHWDGDTFFNVLVGFLGKIKVVNGVSDYDAMFRYANTASCLTAQLVKYIKEKVGDVYIEGTDFRDEEWHYDIKVSRSSINDAYDVRLIQKYEGGVVRIWDFDYED